ncbi:hypothetical protein M409DRAFT_54148 [Zasmidium cellare ATCC 36951]|uniref:Cercosporin MFS transporter CTB4 n=1 Tax=Zasmidium cellare ATCC 36951 TaxID=1080233 RepID=A0A6A6CLN7_ZASCE|nr:uncharacterized protein M409DRAFT_54148 [Zasmidium cellare ATCC 36951]KAF2167553.1 hypothetical protein M409DRAFT_54148 [Zasmidium cellare ATCC 36951]
MESQRSDDMDDSLEKQEAGEHDHDQTTRPDDKESDEGLPETHNQHASKEQDPAYLVDFEDNDPENPMNWSPYCKAFITVQLGFMALCASLASSIISPAETVIAAKFGVSQEVTVLTVSLFVLGFAVGPLMWAPISEVYGRKWSMLPAITVMGLFTIGTAVSRNLQIIIITRFFAGVFGSAPVSNVGASLGDIYEPKVRGIAITFFAVMTVGGPTLGPVIGSALTNNPHLGWRSIFAFSMVVLTFFALPELYKPALLKRKAKRLRAETGDNRYWHPHEQERIRPSNMITKYFSRPLQMLFTEPMVACIAFYASFVYGLLYMTLEVSPIVFREERGFGPVVSTLPFLGLFVGILSAMGINLANQGFYAKAVAKNKDRAAPEARLPPMIIGGIFFTAGLFWFGWTAAPKYHWAIPTVAAGFIGAGFNIIFQQCMHFLIDTYAMYAASATSANTFLRSLLACGLPLAAGPMFRNMGVGPACSVLGALSCLGLPMPLIFMKYGPQLRRMSKFAPVPKD